ncbi:YkvA family protein [Flaviflagellibacter deserti]|uniref:YkvA family protein n=1 Tax=Flaviflagellibacter deserti TaxID=2267266 RepID=A0ABV9Z5K8_9HYPH
MWARLKNWARLLRRDATALWLAARDPRVPFSVKALAALVAAYALSPIDLIPDFIPVLGYLDEVILLPIAIAGLSRLIDPAIMAEHRATAETLATRPVSFAGAAMIAGIWTLVAVALSAMLWKAFQN